MSNRNLMTVLLIALSATGAAAQDCADAPKMFPADGLNGAEYGMAMAMDGKWAVVGACLDWELGYMHGSAYVYKIKPNGKWVEAAKLYPTDAGIKNKNRNESWKVFGASTSISGNTIVVGASSESSVYVFERKGRTWPQVAKFRAFGLPGPSPTESEPEEPENRTIGKRVSVSGDLIVAGCPTDGTLGKHSGAAFVFEKVGNTWIQTEKIISPQGGYKTEFGYDVKAVGESLFITSRGSRPRHTSAIDAVHQFKRVDGKWQEVNRIVHPEIPEAEFGYYFDTDGETLVAHGHYDTNHVFEKSGEEWIHVASLRGELAASVVLSGDRIIAGTNANRPCEVAYQIWTKTADSWDFEQEGLSPAFLKGGMGTSIIATDTELFIGNTNADGAMVRTGAIYRYDISAEGGHGSR